MKIYSKTHPATSQYDSNGCCNHYPNYAVAWFDGRENEAVAIEDYNLTLAQMEQKAIAILNKRKYKH